MPAIGLTVAALVYLGAFAHQLPLFYVGYFLLAIGGAGANFVVYSRAVASHFHTMRGLALGIVIASTGVTMTILPFTIVYLSDLYGWRAAYFALAALSALALLAVYPWLHERKVEAADTDAVKDGMTFREVRRTRRFWTMIVALLLISPVITGSQLHFIAFYSEQGLSKEGGQIAMACFGLTLIFARPIIGLLLDKLNAPLVVACTLVMPGLALLLTPAFGSGFALVLAFALGLGMSAEGDIVGYLTGRYFGMKAFSETYGWLIATATFGFALGPILAGRAVEATGSYDTPRVVGAAFCILAALAFLTLERPHYLRRKKHDRTRTA